MTKFQDTRNSHTWNADIPINTTQCIKCGQPYSRIDQKTKITFNCVAFKMKLPKTKQNERSIIR